MVSWNEIEINIEEMKLTKHILNYIVLSKWPYCLSERYSENGNLSLKCGQVRVVTRSSSGSSHGSGSGSGSSSGYQSIREERELIKEKCQVELDSEEELTEASQVVTVTGGLHLGGDGAIASKVWINIYKYCQSLFFFLREFNYQLGIKHSESKASRYITYVWGFSMSRMQLTPDVTRSAANVICKDYHQGQISAAPWLTASMSLSLWRNRNKKHEGQIFVHRAEKYRKYQFGRGEINPKWMTTASAEHL